MDCLPPLSNSSGLLAAPGFQVLLIECELFLGVWLLSGKQRIGAWLAALAVFSAFAVVSLRQGLIGQASCGCFGKVAFNPWYAFSIDVAAVAALLIARPDLKELRAQPRAVLGKLALLMTCGMAAAGVAALLLFGWVQAQFGSLDAALAYWRHERVSLRPFLVDLGTGEEGEERTSLIELVNRTDHAVRIYGGTSDCSCVATNDLPVTIPAGEARMVSVMMRLPAKPGLFSRRAILMTDEAGARSLSFTLVGRTEKASEESRQAQRN